MGSSRADRSAALFNNRHLVTVVQAIADDAPPEFTTRQIAGYTGLPDSVVRPILHRLRTAEVLVPTRSDAGARGAKYFRAATDTAEWTNLEALCRALAGARRRST